MPLLKRRLPAYVRYKTRFARMRIGGKSIHLGIFNSPESLAKYDELISLWLQGERAPLTAADVEPVDVHDVVILFGEHIKTLFKTKSGRETGNHKAYRPVLTLLVETFGDLPAAEFGPKCLKQLRAKMVERQNSRKYINKAMGMVVAAFKHAASEEMVSNCIYERLQSVSNLRAHETTAPEPRKVLPVDEAKFEKTLEHCTAPVAAMAMVQRLTGMRPGEATQMRPMDVDRSSEIWFYTPREHKTEHHGVSRVIAIGPKAQAVLRKYLLRPADQECFSPRESASHRPVSKRYPPKACYNKDSYARAITRACEEAFGMPRELRVASVARGIRKPKETPDGKVARLAAAKAWRREHCWHPNQLRHSAATEIRAQFGLEAAKATLGHTKTDMTEVYAEKDLKQAAEVARRIG